MGLPRLMAKPKYLKRSGFHAVNVVIILPLQGKLCNYHDLDHKKCCFFNNFICVYNLYCLGNNVTDNREDINDRLNIKLFWGKWITKNLDQNAICQY